MLFFAAVVWGRLDFTITKDKAYHASIAREKARGVLQELQAAWEGEGGAVEGAPWHIDCNTPTSSASIGVLVIVMKGMVLSMLLCGTSPRMEPAWGLGSVRLL